VVGSKGEGEILGRWFDHEAEIFKFTKGSEADDSFC